MEKRIPKEFIALCGMSKAVCSKYLAYKNKMKNIDA